VTECAALHPVGGPPDSRRRLPHPRPRRGAEARVLGRHGTRAEVGEPPRGSLIRWSGSVRWCICSGFLGPVSISRIGKPVSSAQFPLPHFSYPVLSPLGEDAEFSVGLAA